MHPRIWLVAGPTASGKSALALRLAERVDGEIVNADSMQVYHDLRILTARPDVADESRTPHHLFGVAAAAPGWSVGIWLDAVRGVLSDIARRGRTAILVGGTGLYFHALTRGLADAPASPPEVRRAAASEYADIGETAFRARLAKVDPEAAARIEVGDRQRLLRAWEVFAATGISLTTRQAEARGALDSGAWRALALEPPRAELYARCDARLETMLGRGALDEVCTLITKNPDPDLPIMKAVGVREFAAHLRGEITLGAALAAARQETRRYAKRQTTWMRGRMTDWPRITALDPDTQWRQFLALHPDLTT